MSSVPTLTGPVRDWFQSAYPDGPTEAQRLAWPNIAADRHTLLVSPTGTGKTLAAFLSIIDRLYDQHLANKLTPTLRCVYVSPLRSLGYDIERNLNAPLDAIRAQLELESSPIRIGVRTGDTSASLRRKLRDNPPHILITTPESLSLLLSQPVWRSHWNSLTHLIVDEIHALVPTKRGADLSVSLERLASLSANDPTRIGLSATCNPTAPVAEYLVGPTRKCDVLEASRTGSQGPSIDVQSLIAHDEEPYRGLTYRRLLTRLKTAIGQNRTTVVFANTRAFTEKITHDLRAENPLNPESIAAHHSSLDATRRRTVEAALKEGAIRAVVTSTSLELGVDIGQADLSVLVGLPGSVARCLQRVGRAGHQPGQSPRGLLLAASPAELVGAIVTAHAAQAGAVEPLRPICNPLDVLAQQLIGMACAGECSSDDVFALLRKSGSMATLSRADFDSVLDFLAGDLSAPSGAHEPEPGAAPQWTSPRIWKIKGRWGVRSTRVIRWFRANVGTITSEESCRVIAGGRCVGMLESAYADRLMPGDRFVLDGHSFEFRRLDGPIVHANASGGEPALPRWSSDRQGLSAELARDVAHFRVAAAEQLSQGSAALTYWLRHTFGIDSVASNVVRALIEAQERESEIPTHDVLLVEESPSGEFGRLIYAFHAPLGRAAIEALARATSARLGRKFGRDIEVAIADLGWALTMPEGVRLSREDLAVACEPSSLMGDVLDGIDRGELPARRFRHIAATALMVLRNPEGGRKRVGGMHWVSRRLYPLVKAACPSHPLLRETEREVLEDCLDTRSAHAWLETAPEIRLRSLHEPSPFAVAWILASEAEPIRFESADSALERLHARLVGAVERRPA